MKLVVEDAKCQLTAASPPGSCIFYFNQSKQTFCEEYTGTKWDEASASAKCDDRTDGVFKNVSCAERSDETKNLDGDGEYKGACIIDCGTSDEYRWHVYSEPEGMSFEDACPDWIPV